MAQAPRRARASAAQRGLRRRLRPATPAPCASATMRVAVRHASYLQPRPLRDGRENVQRERGDRDRHRRIATARQRRARRGPAISGRAASRSGAAANADGGAPSQRHGSPRHERHAGGCAPRRQRFVGAALGDGDVRRRRRPYAPPAPARRSELRRQLTPAAGARPTAKALPSAVRTNPPPRAARVPRPSAASMGASAGSATTRAKRGASAATASSVLRGHDRGERRCRRRAARTRRSPGVVAGGGEPILERERGGARATRDADIGGSASAITRTSDGREHRFASRRRRPAVRRRRGRARRHVRCRRSSAHASARVAAGGADSRTRRCRHESVGQPRRCSTAAQFIRSSARRPAASRRPRFNSARACASVSALPRDDGDEEIVARRRRRRPRCRAVTPGGRRARKSAMSRKAARLRDATSADSAVAVEARDRRREHGGRAPC